MVAPVKKLHRTSAMSSFSSCLGSFVHFVNGSRLRDDSSRLHTFCTDVFNSVALLFGTVAMTMTMTHSDKSVQQPLVMHAELIAELRLS